MSPGPNTGGEIVVPGRQDLFARRIPIPLAGAPISFGTSTRALFSFSLLLTGTLAMIGSSVFAADSSFAPDLVIVNAVVRTMDPARPMAEAVAVAGNRIAAIDRKSVV